MNKPSLFEILFKKDEQRKIYDNTVKGEFFSRQLSGSITKQLKKIRSSRPMKFISALSNLCTHVSTRVYGSLLFTFGFIGILLYLIRLAHDMSIVTPILGALLSLISIPLLIHNKTLHEVLSDNEFTDHLFYEIFCMKRHTDTAIAAFPLPLAIFFGFCLALLSLIVPLWQIALFVGVIICAYVGIESPEFIFLASLFTLPFVRFIPNGDIWLIGAVAFALLSFLIKAVMGKRVVYIEQYDIFIGIMLLLVFISGIFLKGNESFSGSIRMIVLSVGYILSGNIITNRRLAERSVNAIIASAVICSLVSLVQLVYFAIISNPLTMESANLILARQDGIAVFLIAGTALSVGMIKRSSNHSKNIYVFSAILIILSILLSGEFFALCAVFLCAPVYYILKNNFRPGLLLPLLLVLPLAVLLLPNLVLDVLFYLSPSVKTAEDLFILWENSLGVLSRNLFLGIGIGSESFAEEMAAIGIFNRPDSSNLFIELGLEAGIFALIAFLCILLTRMKHRSVQYIYLRNSQIERLSCISGACMFSLLAFGMVNYIWSEPSAYYFFWCIFGIGSATLRVARKDYDDRVVYYEESSAFDSSVIDIEIG